MILCYKSMYDFVKKLTCLSIYDKLLVKEIGVWIIKLF